MDVEILHVVVSLGTDHHQFNRLVEWIDRWIGQREGEVHCVVQHGFSKPPENAEAVERMPRAELLELYRHADVVVVQGGPGSILDAREAGRIPIAVPRRADLDEVVDGHQRAFTITMVAQGDAILAESYADLISALERALAAPSVVATLPRISRPDLASERLEAAMATGLGGHDRGRARRRIKQLLVARSGISDSQ